MTTATVETLAASVNVLQYGNRQITLSVAKQLDVVSPYSIEPMGRVRLGKNDRPETSVIGSDESGNLVTADFHQLSNGYPLPKLDLPPRSFRVQPNWTEESQWGKEWMGGPLSLPNVCTPSVGVAMC